MNSERIKEIQKQTAYPDSVSVMLALKQVWRECEQEKVENLTIPIIGSSDTDMIEDNRTRCPECKSPNVDLPLRLTSRIYVGKCKCQDCGNEFESY